MIIALHSVLHVGAEADYDTRHRSIPDDLAATFERIGIHDWSIWRSGLDLFHLVEVDDYRRMRAYLRDHPANVPWQARMAELLEVEDDYSGADDGLRLVWRLP